MLSVTKAMICALTIILSHSAFARDFEHIMHRWQNPSSEDIFVVAHRAAFMEYGQIVLPENSIPSIEYAIELGVDMVELDIRATKDGHFILIHDDTLDRTTNGKGAVAELTLEQVKSVNLIDEATGEITPHKIPTLREVYRAVKNRIMVNLDPKLPVKELGQALQIAKDMGVEKQIVLKGTADTNKQLSDIREMLSQLPFESSFMPMHWDKTISDCGPIKKSIKELSPEAVEMVVNIEPDKQVRSRDDGGLLFSKEVRHFAKENSVHLWINTLYIDPLWKRQDNMDRLMWNGGRHDILGLKYPKKVFGFWVSQGATIMQTDEPRFLINWLESNGYREPSQTSKAAVIDNPHTH